MAIKNNDDVAHLLDATGRTGTPYREFETASDQMSAPLIDAIFGKDPPPSEREAAPLQVGSGSGGDLLADVFDRSPGLAAARPADRGGWRDEAFRQQSAPPVRASVSAPMSSSPVRSLSDIRRIITQTVGPTAATPSTGTLNGLFDRLAR
jgi:hypothetical protein